MGAYFSSPSLHDDTPFYVATNIDGFTFEYSLHFDTMTQTNRRTNKTRKIRRNVLSHVPIHSKPQFQYQWEVATDRAIQWISLDNTCSHIIEHKYQRYLHFRSTKSSQITPPSHNPSSSQSTYMHTSKFKTSFPLSSSSRSSQHASMTSTIHPPNSRVLLSSQNKFSDSLQSSRVQSLSNTNSTSTNRAMAASHPSNSKSNAVSSSITTNYNQSSIESWIDSHFAQLPKRYTPSIDAITFLTPPLSLFFSSSFSSSFSSPSSSSTTRTSKTAATMMGQKIGINSITYLQYLAYEQQYLIANNYNASPAAAAAAAAATTATATTATTDTTDTTATATTVATAAICSVHDTPFLSTLTATYSPREASYPNDNDNDDNNDKDNDDIDNDTDNCTQTGLKNANANENENENENANENANENENENANENENENENENDCHGENIIEKETNNFEDNSTGKSIVANANQNEHINTLLPLHSSHSNHSNHSDCFNYFNRSYEENLPCCCLCHIELWDRETDPIFPNGAILTFEHCVHAVHTDCWEHAKNTRFETMCPVCFTPLGRGHTFGTQPPGTCTLHVSPSSCTGFEPAPTIVLKFTFPNGIQLGHHPNPNQPFHGSQKINYIPAHPSIPYAMIVKLYLKAFFLHQLFTIGQSLTTNRDNQLIFGSIHCKTSFQGGTIAHGFPDPSFIHDRMIEFNAVGVTLTENQQKQ